MKILHYVFSFLMVSYCSVGAAAIWVAPDGDDAASGSEAEPLQTFEKALELSREIEEGRSIHLKKGVYFLKDTLRLDGGDSHLIVHGEKDVTLSGGELIKGWEIWQNGLWRAKVPVRGTPRELFVNGKRASRARFPDKGWLRIEKSFSDRRSGFTFNPSDLPGDLQPLEGLELIFLHDWSISRIPVEAIDHGKRELKVAFPIGCEASHYAIDHFEKHPRYALEGTLALLDQPGEWAIQEEYLYYKPKDGETIGKTQAVVPRLTKLLEVAPGEDGVRPEKISIKHLAFAHCRWNLPQEGYASGQATVHEWRDGSGKAGRTFMPAAIEVKESSSVGFTACQFLQLGNSGLWIRGGAESCRVEGCEFSDISGNALNIGEMSSHSIAKKTIVDSCKIYDCGVQFFGSVGIWVGMAEESLILGTALRNLPYTGISVGWRWSDTPSPCKSHKILYNHIHHVMQVLSDGGGIYTLGRQPLTYIKNNYIHDIPVNLGRAHSNGIFMDQGSTAMVVDENIIHGIAKSPIRFHQAGENLIHRNILEVGKEIPAFTFNRTDPKDLIFQDNKEVSPQSDELRRAVEKWEKRWNTLPRPKQ